MGKEDMGSSQFDFIIKNIRHYLEDKERNELVIKIRKIRVALDKSEIKMPEAEIMLEGF